MRSTCTWYPGRDPTSSVADATAIFYSGRDPTNFRHSTFHQVLVGAVIHVHVCTIRIHVKRFTCKPETYVHYYFFHCIQ